MPFVPGVSGNPNGRPKGTRNRLTLARAALFGSEREEVARKLAELAGRGHFFALEALFDPVSLARFKRAARGHTSPPNGSGATAALILEALAAGKINATAATEMLAAAGRLQTPVKQCPSRRAFTEVCRKSPLPETKTTQDKGGTLGRSPR